MADRVESVVVTNEASRGRQQNRNCPINAGSQPSQRLIVSLYSNETR
jgi:hypothetical protein